MKGYLASQALCDNEDKACVEDVDNVEKIKHIKSKYCKITNT
jgi:hypothetical protein